MPDSEAFHTYDRSVFNLGPDDPDMVLVNLRADCGGNAFDQIKSVVDRGDCVLLHDPEGQWPDSAIAFLGGSIRVITHEGHANFATLEAALRHGLTSGMIRIGAAS